MEIHLSNISKKYGRSWVFRDVSCRFVSGTSYAILGANGSGKSTLLQIISGFLSPTRGTITYQTGGKEITGEDFYRYVSLSAPYMELPEELTLEEALRLHGKFRRPLISAEEAMQEMELEKHRAKPVADLSSGMRQRLKLALALFFESEVILLDEPASHLDADSTKWYLRQVKKWSVGRCLIISSNESEECGFCEERVRVEDFGVRNKK